MFDRENSTHDIAPGDVPRSGGMGARASDVLVVPLADVGADDIAVAGGKGANLGELIRAGFDVPDGFVVTTAAYAQVLRETNLGATLAGLLADGVALDGASDDGSAIRDAFAAARMPAAVRDEIAAQNRAYGNAPMAVRSSATAEDLPGAAFAGQQDTYLDVVGEDAVLEAVRKCWASLWTDRAIAYRRRQGIDPHEVAIAVVVQRMVPADAAGVLFTANPVTGRRDEVVIDAGRGLGEAVVSGLITPEHYVLAPDGRIREWSPAAQGVEVPFHQEGGTTESQAGPSAGRILDSRQLTELADTAKRVAEHFGRPQDLEWAISGGRLYILQARPMTALPPTGRTPDFRPNIVQRKLGPFFLEMFQQRPYPLDVDGWLKHVIIAMLHRMAGSVGVAFPGLSALLPEEDGVVVRLVPPVPRPTFRLLAAPVSVAGRVRRYAPSEWMNDDRFTAFRRTAGQVGSREPAEMDWAGLVAHVRRIFAVTGAIADLRVSYLPASFLPQLPLRLILLALGRADLVSTLLAGAETRTEQANRSLEKLAERVRGDAELSRAFEELQPAALLEAVRTDPRFAPFAEEFRDFLDEYGHRETVSIVLSSSPTWSDAPDVVLGLVRVLIPARATVPTDPTGRALTELMEHPALRVAWLRRLARAAVDGSRIGTAFRDDSHFYLTLLLPALRRTYAEMGERLRRAGVIHQATDVFHLRFEELARLGDPAALTPAEKRRSSEIVTARAAKRRALEGTPLLAMEALSARRGEADGVILTGTGASRGQATGPVRIIRDASAFGALRSGEVLVCPYTNPAWTPLFQRAAAVVVDTGGMGSHAAIVAREYGIPAVMGTGNGTSVLTDGQSVTVDGTTGRVLDTPI